jgi:hypothetical protein
MLAGFSSWEGLIRNETLSHALGTLIVHDGFTAFDHVQLGDMNVAARR